MQFSAVSIVKDIDHCLTLDFKCPGDLVYVLGRTKDELGASEYYDRLGYTGLNVPTLDPSVLIYMYRDLHKAVCRGLAASVHGIYRGGLGVHLAMCAMAGNIGINADIAKVPAGPDIRADHLLFSETPGRFIVTVEPENSRDFESILKGHEFSCIGEVSGDSVFSLSHGSRKLASVFVQDLKSAWKAPFGKLI
jgi:phosphoribosylformylglycinamidine synthase